MKEHQVFISIKKEFEMGYRYMHKAVDLNHDQELPRLMRTLGTQYFKTGFPEKAEFYFTEAFKLDGDSVQYYYGRRLKETYQNDDYEKGIEFIKQVYHNDTDNVTLLESMAYDYELLKQFDLALIFYEKMVDHLKNLPLERYNNLLHVGYCCWKVGKLEEADYYFEMQKKRSEDAIIFNRSYAKGGGAFYDLACVYAFKGDKSKAYENLHLFRNTMNDAGIPLIVWFMIRDPFFESMRDEPEFQQILSEVEAIGQAEHERIRKWLEENEKNEPDL